ncbi:MAG: serpin family protein [Desulfobacteraceae bacterium]
MMKFRLLTGMFVSLCLTMSMGMAVAAQDIEEVEDDPFGYGLGGGSQWLAKHFVTNSATFKFDGLWYTLQHTDTTELHCSNCWKFNFEFDCTHSGYGDRIDKVVTSAITHHKASITLEQFRIVRATLDDQWDMINQRLLGEERSQEPVKDPVESLELAQNFVKALENPPTAEEIATRIQSINDFAFELYQQLITEADNLFYSPYSISLSLAMAYAGAAGETETQMADALHFELSQAKLHPAFKSLADELASRNYEEATVAQGRGFKLNIANAAWGQDDYPFLNKFFYTIDSNYDGGFSSLDFVADPEAARITINNWVAEQTNDHIQDLIAQGVLSTLTRLVLTNAVYFNAAWAYPFERSETKEDLFYVSDGRTPMVEMMHQENTFEYSEGEGYQAIKLPYQNEELFMVILLPDAGQFEVFEESMSREKIETIIREMRSHDVLLRLPKFTIEAGFNLNAPLKSLGMINAFSANADFSGINGERSLFISNVIHQGFVAVDEEGTEAAAGTAVIMNKNMAPSAKVIADRPFIFLIQDSVTETILFIGKVMDPSSV